MVEITPGKRLAGKVAIVTGMLRRIESVSAIHPDSCGRCFFRVWCRHRQSICCRRGKGSYRRPQSAGRRCSPTGAGVFAVSQNGRQQAGRLEILARSNARSFWSCRLPGEQRWDYASKQGPLFHPCRTVAFHADNVQPTLEITEQDFDKCFNVNVKGIFFGVRTVLPVLLEQSQGGSVINIASVGATRPRPGLVWYNGSKGAVTNV